MPQIIMANGHTGVSGYGFFLADGRYFGIFGGVNVFDAGPVIQGVWADLMLTDNNGVVRVYRDGALVTTDFGFPNPIPNPNFPAEPVYMMIGASINGDQLFNGAIDEVRVFATPEPSSIFLMGTCLAGLAGHLRRKRKA